VGVPTLSVAAPSVSRKRTAGEKQWFFAQQKRKAAKRRMDEAAAAVEQLAVQREAAVKRLDREHSAAEAAHKEVKRRTHRAVAAMRSLSEAIFDIED